MEVTVRPRPRPSLPEQLPRQKVCLYAFLICCSTVMICFYYYPLEARPWTIRPVASLFGTVGVSRSYSLYETETPTIDSRLKITRGPRNTSAGDDTPPTSGRELRSVPSDQQGAEHATKARAATDFGSHSDNEVETGFLVFSNSCKIPDLDPMHPSIRHLISKAAPLDCSKDYPALTRTEGAYLFLNESAVQDRIPGQNFTCCYRSVQRKNDGETDNGVGFGKDCIAVTDKTKVIYEFIKIVCHLENGTEFYKEYHSFIHDKPSVEKRCNILTNHTQYSVLIIGADSMSRLNMHRQLNRTAHYLLKEMKATEMFGFNKVGDNTFPNLIPMLTGYSKQELPSVCWQSEKSPLDKCNFAWKQFSAQGYRTLYAEDAPHMSTFNYLKRGFLHQPTDYYFRPFMKAYQKELGREKHLNCYWCTGSVSEPEAVLHWTYEFAAHFSNRPYFAFSWINAPSHDFLNKGSAVDGNYEQFFESLHSRGALNKTIVILMGDHGMRWGELRSTYIGRLEERLPMLLISLPPLFKQEHPKFSKHLQQNAHRLVTPFDLYATLIHILNLKENWKLTTDAKSKLSKNVTSRAFSLFQPIPNRRSCDDAFIEEHWCTCESSTTVNLNSKAVELVAKFILDQINKLLKPVSHKCASLTAGNVTDARLWKPPSLHKGHSAEDSIYTVVIEAKPGGALFEGTVKASGPENEATLLGSVSRLNLYGNQSICVDNAVFRKYCYCL